MNETIFMQKWKHDIDMLEDAYKAIQRKQTAIYQFPLCFGVMMTATILILCFIYTTFSVNISYLVVYSLFGFQQIFSSMKSEYDEICNNEISAYDIIELLHSLSPELVTEYEEFCRHQQLPCVAKYAHITASKSLIEKKYPKIHI